MKPTVKVLSLFAILMSGVFSAITGVAETAPYTLLKKEGDFEIRRYENLVLARTSIENAERSRAPFSRLFNFISGDNDKAKEIEMTTPVFTHVKKAERQYMSFIMPSSLALSELPKPSDPDIEVYELEQYTVAAVRFSGRLTEANVEKRRNQLQDWVIENKFKATGSMKTAGYNSPFTLPAFRRNEVLLGVTVP